MRRQGCPAEQVWAAWLPAPLSIAFHVAIVVQPSLQSRCLWVGAWPPAENWSTLNPDDLASDSDTPTENAVLRHWDLYCVPLQVHAADWCRCQHWSRDY